MSETNSRSSNGNTREIEEDHKLRKPGIRRIELPDAGLFERLNSIWIGDHFHYSCGVKSLLRKGSSALRRICPNNMQEITSPAPTVSMK